MKKTAIIVDSTAYLTNEISNLSNVFQVDLSVIFDDGKVFEDTAKMAEQIEFYQYLEQSKQLPKSSQPHPGDYYQLMDQIVAQGFQSVIAIHLSAGISGTFALAQSVLGEYQNRIDGYVVDSKSSCIVIEGLVRIALKRIEEEKEIRDIVKELKWLAEHNQTYLMLEELDNLVKGGRLTAGAATIGQLLKIRPLLHFNEEGNIRMYEKIRTNKKVYAKWVQLIQEAMTIYPQGIQVMMTHANAEQECDKAIDFIKRQVSIPEIYTNSIGPVIGTHTGKGCIGLAIMPNYSEDK